ncbi:MAG: hypothetical protein WCP21_11635 [Armatimonadota bacterium]
MNPAQSSDPTVFTIARFQACTADLRQTVTRLQDLEQELGDLLGQMRGGAHPRERLIVAEAILSDVQAALNELTGSEFSSPSSLSRARQAVAL